jgi:hypothetical protein
VGLKQPALRRLVFEVLGFWTEPYPSRFSLPHCPIGARGSFGWFDRGRLVERIARAEKVLGRSGVKT